MKSRNWQFRWLITLLLALIYYGMAEIGRRVASTPQDVTPVWPPDGFASAAVLIFGYWVYPGICLGSFLANVWAFLNGATVLSGGVSVLKALSIGIGTTLGTLLGAVLLRRSVRGRTPLNHPRDVMRFVSLTGMTGPMVNATVGVLTLCIGGNVPWSAFITVWLTWWISNVAGILIFTPFLLSWSPLVRKVWLRVKARRSCLLRHSLHADRSFRLRTKDWWQLAEAGALLVLVLMIGWTAFWGGHSVEYMLIPFLVWAAFRFGQKGATLLIVVVATIAILGTVNGYGPFIRTDFNESLMLLQSFIGAVVVTNLILVAALTERQKAATRLLRSETRLREQAYRLENTLDQLRSTQAQLIHTERISSLGQLVAGVAHEVNNPVSFICGNLNHAQTYTQDLSDLLQLYRHYLPAPPVDVQDKADEIDVEYLLEDLPKILASMQVGTDRIREIMSSLRTFTRLDTDTTQTVDIHVGLDSTLLILHHRLKAQPNRLEVRLVKDYGELPPVDCYPGSLNQVFMNLIANAIDALEERIEQISDSTASFTPTIWIRTAAQAELVIVSIADNGSGISEAHQAKMFQAFFTTKSAGKGTGLGLSISHQIITEQHGGTLHCVSAPEQGCEFVIQIPIHHASRVAKPSLNQCIQGAEA